MAKDVITRFKLETTAFDSKIKQASKELSDYSKTATQAKEGFNQFTKANVDAARALGTMATSSNNAKVKVQELVSAYNEAAKAYEKLSDEQKQSDWAKALAGSLTQLQQRIKDTKQEMQGLGNEMKSSGLFGGGKLDGMLQVFGGNLMTKAAGFAASFASEIGSCVQQGIELARQGEGIRIAFERLGRGDILQGLREATHGTVTDLELMKAAVKFNDFKLPVEELGTMLAFAQQKAKDTGQSVDYMVDSIVTGLGRKSLMILDNLGLSANEIKEKMKQTGDMTKAVGAIIREQMAKAGDYVETAADRAAQANVSLQNKMEELGRKFAPIEEASNQLWTSMKIGILDIVGGPLARLLNGLTEAGRMKNALNDLNGGGNGKESQTEKALRILREYSGGRRGIEGKRDLYNRQVASYNSQEEKAWREANRLRAQLDRINNRKGKDPAGYDQADVNNLTRKIETAENRAKAIQIMRANYQKGAADILNPASTISTDNPIKPTKTSNQEYDELQKVQQKIAKLTKEAYTADSKRVEEIQAEIAGLQEEERRLTVIRDLVTNKNNDPLKAIESQFPDMSKQNYNTGYAGSAQSKYDSARQGFALGGISTSDISGFINLTKQAIAQSDIGSEMYTKLTEQMKDATTMSTLLNEMMERGVEGTDLTTMAEKMKAALLEGDIPDEKIKEFIEQMNEKIREQGGVELEYNGQTGEVKDKKSDKKDEDDLKKFNESVGKLTGGMSQVTNGLKAVGVQIPKEVDDIIGVINGVSQIITGVGTIISIFGTSAMTANTTAVTLNTTSIGALIAAIEFNTATNLIPGLSGGGMDFGGKILHAATGTIVPGNYGFDAVPAMLTSGEVVLNHAQVGNLASQLEGGSMQNLQLEARIDAEDIIITMNNRGERTGYGEFVQSKNR